MDSSDINLIDRFVLMQVREMKYLYISVIFWVSMTEVILLYHVVFGKEILRISWKKMLFLLLENIIFIIMTAFKVHANYISVVILFTDFYAGCVFTGIKTVKNIKYWIISILLIIVSEQILNFIFGNYIVESENEFGLVSMMSCITVSIMLLVAGRVLKNKYHGEVELSTKIFLIVILMISGIVVCLSYMILLLKGLQEGFAKDIGQLIFLSAIVGVFGFVTILFYIFNQKEYYRMKSDMEREYSQQQREYFLHLLKKEEETRRFRHDVVNHLICIQNAMGNANYQEVNAYLSDILFEIDRINCKQYDIGNEVVNVILNYYLIPIQDKCEISVEGYLGELENISQMDMCTIFSNVIKNAVEAVEKNEIIKIEGKRGKKFAKVFIGNSYTSSLNVCKEGLLETTKGDRKNHGFGMINIQKAMQKNAGTFNYNMEDNWFQVELIFQIAKR